MSNLNYPTASVIIIGNEILSGQTVDANLSFIAKHLSKLGIRVRDARIIPDNEQIIVDTVNYCRNHYTYVFTTGGIGPTHDDITSEAIAKAFGRAFVCNEEALDLIYSSAPSRGEKDARIRMAYMPEDVKLIENPISQAPGFQIDNVFVLAGVPDIAQAMMRTLDNRLKNGHTFYTKTILCLAFESMIANELRTIQARFPHVEIGSYPTWHITKERGVKIVLKSYKYDDLEGAEKSIFKMADELNYDAKVIDL